MQVNNLNNLKNIAKHHSIFSDVRARVATISSDGISSIRPTQLPARLSPEINTILDNIIREYDSSPLYVQLHIRHIFSESLERMYIDITQGEES